MMNAPGGDDKLATLQKILRVAIPAIAGIATLKNPGVGGFAHGYGAGEQIATQNRDRDRQRQIQSQQLARTIAYQAREEARQHRMEAAQLEDQATRHQEVLRRDLDAKERAANTAIAARVTPLLKNPEFMDQVNESGAENYSLNVEGIGPVNLKEAFGRIGVVQGPDGKYVSEAPLAKPERKPLVTGVGPNGEPTRVEDKPGVKVYQRPRAPKEPKETKRRTAIQRLEDPDQPGFFKSYLVDLDTGDIIKEVNPTKPSASHSQESPNAAPKLPTPKGSQKIGRFIVTPG